MLAFVCAARRKQIIIVSNRPGLSLPLPRSPCPTSWGKNTQGNLGLGHVHDLGNDDNELGDKLPYTDLGVVGAHRIDGGLDHTCAILEDGTVKCWGKNFRGALGVGDFRARGDFPMEVRASFLRGEIFCFQAFEPRCRDVQLKG